MAALAECIGSEDLWFTGLRMPVTIRLSDPMSDEEVIAFSRRNRPYRIELNASGELEIRSPLVFDGGRRELFVMAMLYTWADEHGGVCASCDTGFRLPDNAVRSPDVSWTSEARMYGLTAAERRGFPPLCPEFLIEILPESDPRETLEAKMEMWIANGAKLAWMIDPFAATVSVYRPNAAVDVLERPEWVEAGEPVAGFRLTMAKLWDGA